MMCVDGKVTVLLIKLKLEGNHLRKYSKKENFEKDIMHLIEANHQINMTFDHFVSSNTLCKKDYQSSSTKRVLLRQCLLQD